MIYVGIWHKYIYLSVFVYLSLFYEATGQKAPDAPKFSLLNLLLQGGSNMTGTDLYVNKPHCAAAVRT